MPLDSILAMGTLSGATALGQAAQIGTIAAGKNANLTLIPLSNDTDEDPHALLLHSDHPVIATIYRGQLAFIDRTSRLTP